ncbi:signaling lymphocytic activation molecule isoform X2 [Meles meles]|uniref:signaling lymphocytic activation molecule isoform X2 n=1 Tax=Meles meles TaxID=9662 RepID=UPI001E69D50D|nr:signaling lymphocytic activation molecule isoform X2 [Meles meles]
MDPKRLLSLNFLLFLSLAFELSCGTGESLLNCPETPGQLGSSVLLSLASGGISKSMNKSVHVLVTRAESPGNSVKKKIVSLDLPEGGSPRYLENGYTFHLENLSLEILESRKENEGWYFMTLEENFSVRHFCLQLKLYEQVSTPEIKVLNRTEENGNCSLILACDVEKGDYVVYSWSEEVATDLLIPANNSTHLLHLSLSPQNVNNVYVCTVSNPISSRSQTFTPKSQCRSESSGKANQYQPTTEAKSLTIYAQVQKSGSVQKKPDPLPAQDPCTTIYVAAAEPVPDPVQESSSITVYASVTLPES